MKILDVTGNAADIFYVLLMYSGQYDFLPELYEVLGKEKMIQVLDIFAGTTIKFPQDKELERIAAEVSIYMRVRRAPKGARPEVIKDLADVYQTTEDTIRVIYDKTVTIIEDKLGMEILSGPKSSRRYRKQ